jgi:FAD:protein FMN transferase
MTSYATAEWPVWSTTARLVVVEPQSLDDARAIADATLLGVEKASSRFRPDSELQLIAPHQDRGVEVSELLALLVRKALTAARNTDGDVDPTIGGALSAIGYDRDVRLIEDTTKPIKAVVSLRPAWRSVSLIGKHLQMPASIQLDLGATAKAVAADLVAERVAERLGCGVLVSLGGDIATAGRGPTDGWPVLVQDTATDPATFIRLQSGHALATSSTQKRRWRRAGQVMHHIVDPRTGRPADPHWHTVTVAARSCFDANTRSTAAIVRGTRAVSWFRDSSVPARLVDAQLKVTTLAGWPDDRATREGI